MGIRNGVAGGGRGAGRREAVTSKGRREPKVLRGGTSSGFCLTYIRRAGNLGFEQVFPAGNIAIVEKANEASRNT